MTTEPAPPEPATIEYQPGVRALLCTEDGGTAAHVDPADIDHFIAVEKNLLWLDIDSAVTRDLSLLQREFGFHPLALEDAIRPNQRPKIDSYNGYSFVIFYSVTLRERARRELAEHGAEHRRRGAQTRRRADPAPDLLDRHQVALFIGANYLVTVHHGPLKQVDEIAKRWHENIQQIDRSIAALVYSLLDAIVDDYFPVIDEVADLIEDLEQTIFEEFDEGALEAIFTLKKSLLNMRRVIGPERDVLNVLIRRDAPLFGEASLVYFQDVYDHVVRVTDSLDIYRDLLSSALDAYLSMASNRLNELMKRLTGWSIPLMAGALLAGIWGMNFHHMPELSWHYGYLFGLSTIALAMLVIIAMFRRKHWL